MNRALERVKDCVEQHGSHYVFGAFKGRISRIIPKGIRKVPRSLYNMDKEWRIQVVCEEGLFALFC